VGLHPFRDGRHVNTGNIGAGKCEGRIAHGARTVPA
jgi:hypothetical protein